MMTKDKRCRTTLSEHGLLSLVAIYLLATPGITSLNGILMFEFGGLSWLGPLFHSGFSLVLIALGLLHPRVRKNAPAVVGIFGLFAMMLAIHLHFGFSNFSVLDLGQLYKWYMPLMVFVVFYRWRYLEEPAAQAQLSRVFHLLPIIYASLIVLSAASYFCFGYNPTLFPEGTLRFTGFSWAYNATVNVFFICGYASFQRSRSRYWNVCFSTVAFLLLKSKTAIAYFGVLGWGVIAPHFRQLRLRQKIIALTVAIPVLLIAVILGYRQSVRALDPTGEIAQSGRAIDWQFFMESLKGGRMEWYEFMWRDVPSWPMANLLFGNGFNIDRRWINPMWWEDLGMRKYRDAPVDRSDKTIELDMLGHLDLMGVGITLTFALVFYLRPLLVIRLPYFKPYQILLIFLSMFGGHLINNPQSSMLLVFFYLSLAAKTRALEHRPSAVRPDDSICPA